MNWRVEYRGIPLTDDEPVYFEVGRSAVDVVRSLPGEVVYRPPTPDERLADIYRTVREQRYVLLRDPDEHDYDWD